MICCVSFSLDLAPRVAAAAAEPPGEEGDFGRDGRGAGRPGLGSVVYVVLRMATTEEGVVDHDYPRGRAYSRRGG